jgi:biofilm PGA synthesis N-glycosyltransferase PgaC
VPPFRAAVDVEDLFEPPGGIAFPFESERPARGRASAVRATRSRYEAPVPPARRAPSAPRPRVSVIACAYNEEQNLPHFLAAVLGSRGPSFELLEVVCVASGCTDRSVEILADWASRDPRLKVHVQAERQGKASALRLGMAQARGEILLIENPDTVPAPGAIEALVRPFRQPEVSLVCSRVVPSEGDSSLTSRLARVLWEIHDEVSAVMPKAGEAFAIRRMSIPVPADIEDDDTYVGIYAGSQGFTSVYARDAVVFNRVPTVPSDLLRQRYRINRQILGLLRRTGMKTSTWTPGCLVRALTRYVREHPRRFPQVVALMLFEGAIRATTIVTATLSRRPLRKWSPIGTTKRAIDQAVVGPLPGPLQGPQR